MPYKFKIKPNDLKKPVVHSLILCFSFTYFFDKIFSTFKPKEHYMKTIGIEDKIANTLIKLMREKDYKKIKISELVDESGVSRVTFYRHFNSKDDVLYKHLESLSSNYSENINQYYQAKEFHKIIDFIFIAFKENMDLIKQLRDAKLEYIYLNLLNNHLKDNLKSYIDNSYVGAFFAGALYNVSMNWLEEDCTTSIEIISKPFHLLQDAYKKLG